MTVDNQAAAPAGDGAQIVDTSLDGVLARWQEDRKKRQEQSERPQEAPEEAQDAPADQPGDEPEPAAEDADTPDGEPSEPEDEAPQDFIPGNALTRMQDGSVRPVGELKKAWGELQELKKGQGDLTAARQQIDQERAALQQRAQEFDRLMATVGQTGIPEAPSDEFWERDPISAMQQQRRHDAARRQHEHLSAEQQKKAREARDAFSAEQGRKLLDLNPDLKDPAKAQEFGQKFMRVVSAWGLQPHEVDVGQLDHRVVHHAVLAQEKADKWDKLQADRAKATKKTEGAAPVQAPGRRLTPGESRNSQVELTKKRAQATGQLDDVLAYYSARKG
jgi:hypothetical protein